jgi:hypothetical protein
MQSPCLQVHTCEDIICRGRLGRGASAAGEQPWREGFGLPQGTDCPAEYAEKEGVYFLGLFLSGTLISKTVFRNLSMLDDVLQAGKEVTFMHPRREAGKQMRMFKLQQLVRQ